MPERDCNQEQVRERLTAHLDSLGETLSEFSLSCCDGDMCNAPGNNEKNSASAMIVTLIRNIHFTKCLRVVSV